MKTLLNINLIVLLFLNCQSDSLKQSEILKFEIVEKQDNNFAGTTRVVNRVLLNVESFPSKQDIENTATYIWENGNKNLNEFTVYIYLPGMNTQQSAYGIGEFNENGLLKFEINDNSLYGSKWEIKEISELIEQVDQVSETELKDYSIKISVVTGGTRKVKITVTTNFPDGTNLLLSIGRTNFRKGKSEEYSGEIFSNSYSVDKGKIETTVEINDSEWYNEHQRLVKELPNDISPIVKISDNITIDILYTSVTDQPQNVIKILGTKGEYVTGNGVEKNRGGTIGLLTSLRESKEFLMPFKR